MHKDWAMVQILRERYNNVNINITIDIININITINININIRSVNSINLLLAIQRQPR